MVTVHFTSNCPTEGNQRVQFAQYFTLIGILHFSRLSTDFEKQVRSSRKALSKSATMVIDDLQQAKQFRNKVSIAVKSHRQNKKVKILAEEFHFEEEFSVEPKFSSK